MADGRVAVATYNHPAQLVMLDRNLRQTGSMTVPSQIYVLAFTDAGLVCSLADEPAVTVVRRPE
jgi:predicted membrane-bound spermidine synthase